MRLPVLTNLKIHWRTIQICINIGSIVTGFCAFLPLGYVRKMFVNFCVLYGEVKIKSVTSSEVVLDTENSKWGKPTTCDFAIFTTVMASVHAFIWIWFFLTMKAQLKKEGVEFPMLMASYLLHCLTMVAVAEFPMLMASFLLHCLTMVAVFVSSGVISAGVDILCRNMAREFDRKTRGNISSCAEAQGLTWDVIGEKYSFHKFLLISKVSSWLCVITIICQSLVCGYKLYVWALPTLDKVERFPEPEQDAKSNGYIPVNSEDVTTIGDVTITNSDIYSEEVPTCSSYVNGNGQQPKRHWITSTTSDTSMAKMV